MVYIKHLQARRTICLSTIFTMNCLFPDNGQSHLLFSNEFLKILLEIWQPVWQPLFRKIAECQEEATNFEGCASRSGRQKI